MPVYYGNNPNFQPDVESPYGSPPPTPDPGSLEPPTIGETPYTGEKVPFIKRMMRGLGQRRINQIVGGLGAQAGQQDRYGTWVNGPDPFQAGIAGSVGAGRAYDVAERADENQLLQAMLANRRVAAAETAAGASKQRADAYTTYMGNRAQPISPGDRETQRLEAHARWWAGLSDEERKQAIASGLAPREPQGRAPTAVKVESNALRGRYPSLTEDEADYLAGVKTSYLGSTATTTYDEKDNPTTTTQRRMGLPALAAKILQEHGIAPAELFAITGGEGAKYAEGTPASQDDVDLITSPSQLEAMLSSGALQPEQEQWVSDRLDEVNQMIEDGEMDNPDLEEQPGGFGPDRSSY